MTSVAGRTSVVTGGASGIGAALSAALIDRGARVLIADRDAEAARAGAEALGARWSACDVAELEEMQRLHNTAHEVLGGADLVVLNAGVGSFGQIADMTPSDWEWMLGVNLWGVINGVSAFLPTMLASGSPGHFVITGSMASLVPSPGLGAYAVAKSGVLALGEALSAEMAAQGAPIGVTVAMPGPTRTNISSSQRTRADRGGLVDRELEETGFEWIRWRSPEDVAGRILDAVEADQFYAATHPEMLHRFDDRVARIRAAFAEAAE